MRYLPHTSGLFTHKTRPIWCTLTVDDDNFGVNYIGREHTEHLMSVLKQHYKMSEDWKGDIFMPNYVHTKLFECAHKPPKQAKALGAGASVRE